MLNVNAVDQKPTEMELAATEIAVEIVCAVNIPQGGTWDFNKINSLISEIKNPQLRLMALQDTYFLLAYFNHFQGGAKNVLAKLSFLQSR
ncbi:MAG: hypothetical protein Q8N21_04990 [bacterium]|nr:hypothetical protein [bacterium]